MYDELTRGDVQKMQEEIDYRTQVLRPKLIEDVQTARAFGDLSENFEYKCAKQEKNRNDSRIRYLQRMIKTARIIDDRSGQDAAGLYDTVEIFMENTGKSRRIQLVTTLRQDALKGLISKESPVGKAVLGRRAGDRVQVDMGGGRSYWITIRSIEKGTDDGSIQLFRQLLKMYPILSCILLLDFIQNATKHVVMHIKYMKYQTKCILILNTIKYIMKIQLRKEDPK